MRVLVTGGNGFIGGWLVRRLVNRRVDVRVLDLQPPGELLLRLLGNELKSIDWQLGDISNFEQLRRAVEGCSAVAHLAAALGPVCDAHPARGAEVNLGGTLGLLELCREAHPRFVYASTAGIFGPYDGETPAPTTHYGVSKLASELSAKVFWANDRVSSTGLRPLTVYGPGRLAGHSAGPTLACRAAVLGEPFVIPFTGVTDFIFVDDVAAALEAALFEGDEGSYSFNINGVIADTSKFIEIINEFRPGARITCEGSSVPIAPVRPGNDVKERYPHLPHTDLHSGIEQTLEYYEQGKSSPTPLLR